MEGILTLRGQEIKYKDKMLYITIRKVQKNMFSLSDKIKDELKRGYNIEVTLPDNTKQIITKDTKYLFCEEVKSKWIGLNSWYRYWYSIVK